MPMYIVLMKANQKEQSSPMMLLKTLREPVEVKKLVENS
jgi:hypothetical protein